MATTLRFLVCFFSILCGTQLTFAGAPVSSVSPEQALSDAEQLASLRPDWSVFQAAGNSMEPFFGSNSLLIVQAVDTASLRPGMIAVYRDAEGDLVGHQVVSIGAEILAKGANNAVIDPTVVRADNLVGIVVGMLHAADTQTTALQVVHGKRY
ncbi:MAG: hypothetical protein Q7P63_09905 [Verrucomicrobiota bacterium JB022]|nr:hypothetical protein [Verrucomicrobiota bacterium JB022]